MRVIYVCALALAFLMVLAEATVYFKESFDDDEWESRWTRASAEDKGKFIRSAGKYYGDKNIDMGIQTSQDAKFYAISSKFKSFTNEGEDLVIQFSVKHEQNIDCGGGYVKLFPSSFVPEDLTGDSPYSIMFGPDICGPSNKKVHVIFNYKGKTLLINKDIRCKDDTAPHLYTLIVRSDHTYEVLIDNNQAAAGTLEEDWDFLLPKKILDPEAQKPDDLDERPKIADPEDVKPADWDDEPEYIVDPEAEKPEDWDDDMDGEWEAPQIENTKYNGEWEPRMIDNPNFSKWVHPEIDNPDYKEDPELYLHEISAVGIDIWQVKSGTIFDNFFIGNDIEEARKDAEETFFKTRDGEKEAREAAEAAKMKAQEEAAAATAENEEVDDEMEDESEEDYSDENADLKDEL